MSRSKIRLFRVDLRPTKPLLIGATRLAERTVLRIVSEAAETRYVDCSPLPYLHRETFDDCLTAAKDYFSGQRMALPIALQTAIDSLSYPFGPPKDGHWENSGLLGLEAAREHCFRVYKIKAGSADFSRLECVLDECLSSDPHSQFRLDCNQRLSSHDLSRLKALVEKYPIQYIEEPSASLDELKAWARILPLGLDENLGRDSTLDALAKAWVIKPNVLGWSNTVRRLQDKSGVQKVLSNVYESNASLQLYAYLYAQCTALPAPLGFGTAFYFDEARAEWNPRVAKGSWPRQPFAQEAFEGALLWEN
jgi:O-succinylbenzoate synthase